MPDPSLEEGAMITIRIAGIAGLAAALAAAGALAGPPLAVKTGAWEVTVTTATEGLLIAQSVLDKLPPENRARMLAAARQRAGKTTTHVAKSCLTPEDLNSEQGWGMGKDDNGECTTTALATTPTLRRFEMVCGGDNARRGQGAFTVKSPTQMSGVMDLAGETGKLHMEMSARWLGSSCKGIDE
jgi:hypothetical protein